jgi:hypothetical protein
MDKTKDYNDDVFINNLVDTYRSSPTEELKAQILKEFDPYFKKYVLLLCSFRPVDFSNKDTITFLRLFMSDKDRANGFSVLAAAKHMVGYLRNLFKDCTQQDLYDELVCYFLEQLYRYVPMIADHKSTKPRISFTHFMQVNVRYRLKTLCSTRAKDALYCVYNVEYKDEVNGSGKDGDAGVNFNEIDLRWTRGITSGDLFSRLEESERYLLYLKYESNGKALSDYSMARITGMDRMYVRRKMLKIRDKLKDLVEIS